MIENTIDPFVSAEELAALRFNSQDLAPTGPVLDDEELTALRRPVRGDVFTQDEVAAMLAPPKGLPTGELKPGCHFETRENYSAEITRLRNELAASRAREKKMRDAMQNAASLIRMYHYTPARSALLVALDDAGDVK